MRLSIPVRGSLLRTTICLAAMHVRVLAVPVVSLTTIMPAACWGGGLLSSIVAWQAAAPLACREGDSVSCFLNFLC